MAEYIPPYGYRHIAPGGAKDLTCQKYLNHAVLKDYERFVQKVNERTLYKMGILQSYDAGNDPALGLEVEYFHPTITADDRMVYIMENIVSSPTLSWTNIIGNTIISHFYGARGVHSVLTGEDDPKKAHVNFDQLAEEQISFKNTGKIGSYTKEMRLRATLAKKNKLKVWGTTELHTSLQTAGRRFVNGWYLGEPRHESKGSWLNICEWIASWVHLPSRKFPNKTVMEGIKNSNALKEAYEFLTGENMIGEYYGYHCSTSNSVNPALSFNHDDVFVAPGPGARETLDKMFPNLSTRQVSYGDRVVWIRENQHSLLNLTFHPALWNYVTAGGITIFRDSQNELKSYGTEVSLCQYSVYCRLRSNPELIARRKVARTNLQESKTEIKINKNSKEKIHKKEKKVWDITKIFSKKKTEPKAAPKVEEKTKATPVVPQYRAYDCSITTKEQIILDALSKIGPSSHGDVLKEIKAAGKAANFDLQTNWKETWKIMKEMVQKEVLEKNGKVYNIRE